MPKITGRRYLPILDLGQITATVCATLHSRAHSRQPKPTARATQLKAWSHYRSSTMHSSVNELLGSLHYLPPPSPCPQRFSLRTTPASHEVSHRGQGPSGRGSRSRNNATNSQTPSRPSACEQSPAAGARALDEWAHAFFIGLEHRPPHVFRDGKGLPSCCRSTWVALTSSSRCQAQRRVGTMTYRPFVKSSQFEEAGR